LVFTAAKRNSIAEFNRTVNEEPAALADPGRLAELESVPGSEGGWTGIEGDDFRWSFRFPDGSAGSLDFYISSPWGPSSFGWGSPIPFLAILVVPALCIRTRPSASARARIELIAHVSHDLRTPIAVIRGHAEGLRDGVASGPEVRGATRRPSHDASGETDVAEETLNEIIAAATGESIDTLTARKCNALRKLSLAPRHWIEEFSMGIGFIALGLGLLFLFGRAVMLLWNWLMPDIFGLRRISYRQGRGLLLLCSTVFKNVGSGASGKLGHYMARHALLCSQSTFAKNCPR
jgi:hypothetical protein